MGAKVRAEPGKVPKQLEKAPNPVQSSFNSKIEKLVDDPQAGTFISVPQIPNQDVLKRWEKRLGEGDKISNLYKLDLAHGWRALYTVLSSAPEGERFVLVIEVVSHKEYDRLLGY